MFLKWKGVRNMLINVYRRSLRDGVKFHEQNLQQYRWTNANFARALSHKLVNQLGWTNLPDNTLRGSITVSFSVSSLKKTCYLYIVR